MSNIASRVRAAMARLRIAASGAIIGATMTNTIAGAYNVSTGTGGADVSTATPLSIIIDKYSSMDLLNTSIQATDVKLIALNDGVKPITGSVITFGSETLTVISVSETYVGEYVPIFELQCRK
jgi:hypothetical protein